MNWLLPGMYVAASSPLHRLDTRVKGAAALILMVAPFLIHQPVSHILLTAFVLSITAISAVPLRALLRTLQTVFWIGLLMFFFYFVITPGHPLLRLGRVTLTREGLVAGGIQIYRLCLLVVVSALLTYTTSPTQLAHTLESLLSPLRHLGLPTREGVLVLTIALRFVPTLYQEMEQIVKAQQARGADIRSRAPWRRVRAWIPVFVPLFVAAFRRAEELALALEARGFRGGHTRTRLTQPRLTWRDALAALVMLGLIATIWGVEHRP